MHVCSCVLRDLVSYCVFGVHDMFHVLRFLCVLGDLHMDVLENILENILSGTVFKTGGRF